MRATTRPSIAALLLVVTAQACADPEPPDGITCASQPVAVSDSAALTAALGKASSGDCVLLHGGTYSGSFAVTGGVTVAGVAGEVPILTSGESAAVSLVGQNAVLANLEIEGAAGLGLFVDTAKAEVVGVTIRDAGWAGAGIRCQDSGCFFEGESIDLTDLVIEDCGSGLLITGGQVNLLDVSISGSNADSLAGGVGLSISGGAEVSSQDTRVSGNLSGVLVDGADTRFVAVDLEVLDNRDRGLWAQGLRATPLAPGLSLSGSGTRIADNGIVGVGLYDALGVALVGAEVSGTVLREVQITVSEAADIGDGVGIFAGSGDVAVSDVELSGNGRAQALIDAGGAGIVFTASNTVDAAGGLYEVVIQNTTETVSVPATDTSTVGSNLAVAADRIPVPDLGL